MSIFLIVGCAISKEPSGKKTVNHLDADMNDNAYLFVVQINETLGDTIWFKTIEIYSPKKIVDLTLYDENGTEIPSSTKYINLCKRNVKRGFLKGAKKHFIGGLFILSAELRNIDEDGFVVFDTHNEPQKIDLANYHRFPIDCND